ncbi:conserved hypothetical protein [Hahella chejuensis KCTC 2396]|uniref:WD40 repeat domain-containing protein n=1 Tax=Hahella chejuensis (strain KCTC 2396) TaxID=349521 RepID=Q2SMP6_HAHCH|nr:WD40 repeat domain-containing protein [Hahella chejuensis]ABC28078.1 conserved hypothetical protein [Hahella chejuensis KCTC 2396]
MTTQHCSHANPHICVCPHVFDKSVQNGVKRFIGVGEQAEYLCSECAKAESFNRCYWCDDCFAAADADCYWSIAGMLEIKREPKEFHFTRREIHLDLLSKRRLLALEPLKSHPTDAMLFTDDGGLWRVNLQNGESVQVATLPVEQIHPAGAITLKISPDNQFLAITSLLYRHADEGSSNKGLVLNLSSGEVLMQLDAGDYHMEEADFPVAFFEHDGKTLLVRATDWNQLDIFDPRTGECLTQRHSDTPPEHDEDATFMSEWSGALAISPNGQRIATIGWVWHPVGVAYSWDLQHWLNHNAWEPDIGESKVMYASWDYFWSSPFFWIDEDRICIWGCQDLHTDYDVPLASAAIFDAKSGDQIKWFAGPTMNAFYYDQYLFSTTEKGDAITIWDLESGALLYEYPCDLPVNYLPGSREFVCNEGDGVLGLYGWSL